MLLGGSIVRPPRTVPGFLSCNFGGFSIVPDWDNWGLPGFMSSSFNNSPALRSAHSFISAHIFCISSDSPTTIASEKFSELYGTYVPLFGEKRHLSVFAKIFNYIGYGSSWNTYFVSYHFLCVLCHQIQFQYLPIALLFLRFSLCLCPPLKYTSSRWRPS